MLSEADLHSGDGYELPNDDEQGYDVLELTASTDNVVCSYFERGEPANGMVVDLQKVYLIMAEELRSDFLMNFPPILDLTFILENMPVKDPQNEFATEKNKVVVDVINSNS